MTDSVLTVLLLLLAWIAAIGIMKLRKPKTGVYEVKQPRDYRSSSEWLKEWKTKAYDPQTDEQAILKGEVESYFD